MTACNSPLAIFIRGRVLDSFSPFPTYSYRSIYVPCGRQIAPPRLNRSAPNHWCMSKGFASARMRFRVGSAPARAASASWNCAASDGISASSRSPGDCTSSALVLVIRAPHGAFSYMPLPRSDDAEWPKDKYEHAPIQTGRAICRPRKAVVIECRPPRTERLSQRAKKL